MDAEYERDVLAESRNLGVEAVDQNFLASLFTPAHERAIVTGGGSGIGRATAIALARLGCKVYILGRRQEALDETVALGPRGRICAISSDIRDPATVESFFSQIDRDGGPAQILVHAAAESYPKRFEELTPEMFSEVISSQLTGAFHIIHRWGVGLLRAKLPGVGVAITSSSCSRETPGLAHSSASKGGVQSMVRSAAAEWASRGIRLNCVGPGVFPLKGVHHSDNWQGEERARFLRSRIPLGRVGVTDEIVGPIVSLVSRSGAYATGQVFVVDGGLTLLPTTVTRSDPLPEFAGWSGS